MNCNKDFFSNYALLKSVLKYDASDISFLFKYVDDIVSSAHPDRSAQLLSSISADVVGMDITLSAEDENSSVTYLDCNMKRNPDGTISTSWSKKSYSSCSILNKHSYHPEVMKENSVRELVRHAFSVTTEDKFQDTKDPCCAKAVATDQDVSRSLEAVLTGTRIVFADHISANRRLSERMVTQRFRSHC